MICLGENTNFSPHVTLDFFQRLQIFTEAVASNVATALKVWMDDFVRTELARSSLIIKYYSRVIVTHLGFKYEQLIIYCRKVYSL